jgi:hypothetical protein
MAPTSTSSAIAHAHSIFICHSSVRSGSRAGRGCRGRCCICPPRPCRRRPAPVRGRPGRRQRSGAGAVVFRKVFQQLRSPVGLIGRQIDSDPFLRRDDRRQDARRREGSHAQARRNDQSNSTSSNSFRTPSSRAMQSCRDLVIACTPTGTSEAICSAIASSIRSFWTSVVLADLSHAVFSCNTVVNFSTPEKYCSPKGQCRKPMAPRMLLAFSSRWQRREECRDRDFGAALCADAAQVLASQEGRSSRRAICRRPMKRGVEGVHQSLCLVFRRSSSFANAVRAKSACFSPSSSAALTCRNVPFGTRTRIRSSIGGRPRLGFFAINPPKFSDIAYLIHCTLRYLLIERQDATELVAKYNTKIFRKPNHVDHDY